MKRLLNFRISKKEWISFVLTLIATLVGVLIAIWLTNSGIRSKEKEDTVKLLQAARGILANTKLYADNLNKAIVHFEKDSANYPIETIEDIKKGNPIPYPDLLETIISNELVSKNVSESTLTDMYLGLINLRKLADYESVDRYLQSLELLMLSLSLEIDLLKGEINITELEAKFEREEKRIEDSYDIEVQEIKLE